MENGPKTAQPLSLTPDQRLGLSRKWWVYRVWVNPIEEAFTTAFVELFTPTINGILAQRAASGLTPANWTQFSAAIHRNRRHVIRSMKSIPSVNMLYTFASALQVDVDVLLPKLKNLLPIATKWLVGEYGKPAVISRQDSEIYAFYLLADGSVTDLDPAMIQAAAACLTAPIAFDDATRGILTAAEAVGSVLRKYVAVTLLENPVSIGGGDHGRFK